MNERYLLPLLFVLASCRSSSDQSANASAASARADAPPAVSSANAPKVPAAPSAAPSARQGATPADAEPPSDFDDEFEYGSADFKPGKVNPHALDGKQTYTGYFNHRFNFGLDVPTSFKAMPRSLRWRT